MPILWACLAGVLLFLSFNRHSKTGIFYYRSQIFGDKAGYYVYLPAAFIYSFDATLFPESLDLKTGSGFRLDSASRRVITKYNYGVSLMQMPFFLAAHLLAGPLGIERNGFSLIYHWALDVAAVTYLLLSFLLLYRILIRRFAKPVVILTLAILFLGTHLFYYSLVEGSMSHIYSFSLFVAWIYLSEFWDRYTRSILRYGAISGFIAALILLVRPLNALFLAAMLFYNKDFAERLRFQLRPGFIIPFILLVALTVVPQLIYWKYLSGDWFTYTYSGESFSNWDNPQVIRVLFAPHNGHLLYNPLLLVILVGLVSMVRHKQENGRLIALTIAVIVYFTASWWIWSFGCGYGARNLVEYHTLLSFPLAFLLSRPRPKWASIFLYSLVVLLCLYNLKMIYSYGGCWFGQGDWDWGQYLHWLTKWPA